MSPAVATEREMYLAALQSESQTTLRLLKAYPAEKIGLKPHERSQSAREVAWTRVMSQHVTEPILAGELMPQQFPPAPETWPGIVGAFEQAHRDALKRLERTTDADFHGMVRMPVGPKQVGNVRRGDALWMMLHDSIHHRGQLSVYLRMAGGRVPSIYRPSGDEPWW